MRFFMFKMIGALGLILISIALLLKNRKKQDVLYILGGIFLELYSLHLHDSIFIVLQIIFTLSAVYDLCKCGSKQLTKNR
ncbi:MAG: hypothetical protein NT003_01885 [Candidatus Magasanikbacteria bacterium]|nr:hypothetical protein [Candidatus Magasanikbacteria bacterium]